MISQFAAGVMYAVAYANAGAATREQQDRCSYSYDPPEVDCAGFDAPLKMVARVKTRQATSLRKRDHV